MEILQRVWPIWSLASR